MKSSPTFTGDDVVVIYREKLDHVDVSDEIIEEAIDRLLTQV